MTFTAAPPIPDSSVSEPTFDAQWQAFNTWAANTHVPELNAALPLIESAADASAAAIAAANYKGLWSSLSGPLAIPATVVHSGVRWMLTESVANVAAEVPGVSAKWLSLSATQTYELISTTSAAAAAKVEWTNFDTLAATYSALRVLGSGIVASAGSNQLMGQIRQDNTWRANSDWACQSIDAVGTSTALSMSNQLTTAATAGMTLDMDISGIGLVARPLLSFSSIGATHPLNTMVCGNVGTNSHMNSWVPTTALQGLRISANTGTISGVFRLYGVRK